MSESICTTTKSVQRRNEIEIEKQTKGNKNKSDSVACVGWGRNDYQSVKEILEALTFSSGREKERKKGTEQFPRERKHLNSLQNKT